MGTACVAHVAVISSDSHFCVLVSSILADERTIVCEVAMDSLGSRNVGGVVGAPDLIVLDYQHASDVYRSMRRLRRRCPTSTMIVVANVPHHRGGEKLFDEGADAVCLAGSLMLPGLLNAAARRARAVNADTRIAFGDLVFDREHRRAWSAGMALSLSPREYDVLHCLFHHAPRAVGRETLTEFVWGPQNAPAPNAIEVYVGYLRRKLSRGSTVAINTVRGVGYELAFLMPSME